MKKTALMIGALGASVFENPVAGEVPADSLPGTTMTFVSYGGGMQEAQKEAFSTPFSEATGATVLDDGPTDMAKLQAQVESGNTTWDVVNASPANAEAYCGELPTTWADFFDTEKFKPVYDAAIVAPDTFSIAKGSKNMDAAYAYINFALGAEQQAGMTEGSGYSGVNVDAKPELDALGNEFDIAQHMEGTIPQNAEYWAENLDALTADWSGCING